MTLQRLGQVFACLAITSIISLIGITQTHANSKKSTKEKTAQECKLYTDKIDYQVTIVSKRYSDLINDPLVYIIVIIARKTNTLTVALIKDIGASMKSKDVS